MDNVPGQPPKLAIPRITSDQVLSNPIINSKTGLWEITVLSGNGNAVLDVLEYPDEEAAQTAIDEELNRQVASSSRRGQTGIPPKPESNRTANRRELAELREETGALENMFQDFEDSIADTPRDELVAGDESAQWKARQEEIRQEKSKFNDEFVKEEEACSRSAKLLLDSIAQVFLRGYVIDKESYMAHKMLVEESSLASLLFQLKTSRRAIHRLSQDIHLGTAVPRQYEVLAQLQRVVLDISKFQHEYMISLEGSMRQIAEELMEKGLVQASPGATEAPAQLGTGDGEETVISTRHRRDIVKTVNSIISDSSVVTPTRLLVPVSRNKNLHDADDQELVEVAHMQYDDESLMAGTGGSSGVQGFGLDTYEDDNDEEEDDEPINQMPVAPRRPPIAPDDDDDDYQEGDASGEEEY